MYFAFATVPPTVTVPQERWTSVHGNIRKALLVKADSPKQKTSEDPWVGRNTFTRTHVVYAAPKPSLWQRQLTLWMLKYEIGGCLVEVRSWWLLIHQIVMTHMALQYLVLKSAASSLLWQLELVVLLKFVLDCLDMMDI